MSTEFAASAFEHFETAFGPAVAPAACTYEDVLSATSAEDVLKAVHALTRVENIGRPSTRDPKVALKRSLSRTIAPALRNLFETVLDYTNQPSLLETLP
jgi:hypothetical protein